jgi:hypothetical protein
MSDDFTINTPTNNFDTPADGSHQAVLLDIVDLHDVETTWGMKHKLKFIWGVEENGKQLEVHQRFNWTLHEKSALRKTLKTWLRRDPGPNYNVGPLKGNRATLVTERVEYEGKTFANVIAVLPPQDGNK